MPFDDSESEKLPQVQLEVMTRSLEKTRLEESFERITPEEMKKYHELSDNLTKLKVTLMIYHKVPQKDLERQKIQVQKELTEIQEKAIKEKEGLIGPVFDREGFLANLERQADYVNFLKSWDQLSEEEQFNRLNRVGNELKNMRLSTEAEQVELQDNFSLQEEVSRCYLKIMKEAKPLNKEDEKAWQEILQNGIASKAPILGRFRPEELKYIKLQNRGLIEAEMLIGPQFADFEILASPSLRRYYVTFLNNWNNFDPDERRNRLERAKDIDERLNKQDEIDDQDEWNILPFMHREPSRAHVFQLVRDSYDRKKKKMYSWFAKKI